MTGEVRHPSAMTIFKYRLDGPESGHERTTDGRGLEVKLELPCDAQILSVGAQGDGIFLWAVVDQMAEKQVRRFRIFGTGWEMADGYIGRFLGTVHRGGLVWHIWEAPPRYEGPGA